MPLSLPAIHREAALRTELYARVAETERPPDVVVDPAHKWRVVSALQKSIRRGHVHCAVRFATQVHSLDPAYLWRRLGIIALEDVGLGDPLACALAFEAARNARFRGQLGELKVVGAVVAGLAESVKSRAITDALIIRGTPTHTLSPEAFKAHVESYEAPWLVRYLAIRGYSHADLGKFVLPVYDVLKDSDVVIQEREPDAVGDELIEGVPAATFDIFTSEGKRVASYLSKCPPFRSYAPAQISMAMFHAEGAYLNRSVASVELAALDLEAKLIDWRSVGIGNSTHVVELMRVFREQRALINHARRRIMG